VHLWKHRAPARRLVAVVPTFFAFSIGQFKALRLRIAVSPAKPSFSRTSAPGGRDQRLQRLSSSSTGLDCALHQPPITVCTPRRRRTRSFPEPRAWATARAIRLHRDVDNHPQATAWRSKSADAIIKTARSTHPSGRHTRLIVMTYRPQRHGTHFNFCGRSRAFFCATVSDFVDRAQNDCYSVDERPIGCTRPAGCTDPRS